MKQHKNHPPKTKQPHNNLTSYRVLVSVSSPLQACSIRHKPQIQIHPHHFGAKIWVLLSYIMTAENSYIKEETSSPSTDYEEELTENAQPAKEN